MTDFSNLTVNLEPNLAALLGDRLRKTNEATMNKAFTSVADNAERRSLPGESEFDVAGSRFGGGEVAPSEASGMDLMQRVAAATANVPARKGSMANSFNRAFGQIGGIGNDPDPDDDGDDEDLRTVTEVREAPRARFIPERKSGRRGEDSDSNDSERSSSKASDSRHNERAAARAAKKISSEEETRLKLDLALYLQRVSRKLGPEHRLPRAVELSMWDLEKLRHHKRVYKAMYDESENLNMLRNLYVAAGAVFCFPTTMFLQKQMDLTKANFVDYMYELHVFYAGSLKGTTRDMPMDPVLLELMSENEFVRQICGKWSRLIYGQIMFSCIYCIKLQNERDEQLNKSIADSNATAEQNKNALNEAMARGASSIFNQFDKPNAPPSAPASNPFASMDQSQARSATESPVEVRPDPFAEEEDAAEEAETEFGGYKATESATGTEEVIVPEDFSETDETEKRFVELDLEKGADSPQHVDDEDVAPTETTDPEGEDDEDNEDNEDNEAGSPLLQAIEKSDNEDATTTVSGTTAASVGKKRGRKPKATNVWTIKADALSVGA